MSHENVSVVPSHGHVSREPFDSERLPETISSGVQRLLRIANLIESEEPRIAYLCRFHAFEVSFKMDRQATGRGVRQFRTSLLKRLEQDNELTYIRRGMKSDAHEIKRVYNTYKEYIIKHGASSNLDDSRREKLITARRVASVLYEVLKAVTSTGDTQVIEDRESIPEISEFSVPYYIHPSDKGRLHQAIMHLPDMTSWRKQSIIIIVISTFILFFYR